jgi:hypothetical protein
MWAQSNNSFRLVAIPFLQMPLESASNNFIQMFFYFSFPNKTSPFNSNDNIVSKNLQWKYNLQMLSFNKYKLSNLNFNYA